jgi:hypothetical protein
MDKICKYIDKELDELENKVAMGGKLSRADIEDGKNMAKFKTAILTNKAMEEEGYSGDWDEPMHRMSNARGRSNARRDSMGRYSREDGYSRAESEFKERLEEAIDSAPDEHKRKKLERILNEM